MGSVREYIPVFVISKSQQHMFAMSANSTWMVCGKKDCLWVGVSAFITQVWHYV